MYTLPKMSRDSHVDALNGMQPILADDVREWKTLLRTVNRHGLSLVRIEIEAVFHNVHFSGASVGGEEGAVPVDARVQEAGALDKTDRADEDDESCSSEGDDGG